MTLPQDSNDWRSQGIQLFEGGGALRPQSSLDVFRAALAGGMAAFADCFDCSVRRLTMSAAEVFLVFRHTTTRRITASLHVCHQEILHLSRPLYPTPA